jgi:hypothetical protein
MSVDFLVQLRLIPATGEIEARSFDSSLCSVDSDFSPLQDLLDEAENPHAVWLECVYAFKFLHNLDVEEWRINALSVYHDVSGPGVSDSELLTPELHPSYRISEMLLDCVVAWKLRFRASKFAAIMEPLIPKPETADPAPLLLQRWACRASLVPKIRGLYRWLEKEKWLCISGMIRRWKSEALDEYFEDEWQWAGVFQDILPITEIIAKDKIGPKGNIRVCYHCRLGSHRLEWIPASTITSAGGEGHNMMKAFNKTLRTQTRIPISPSAQSPLGTPSRISASILKITKIIGGNRSVSAQCGCRFFD